MIIVPSELDAAYKSYLKDFETLVNRKTYPKSAHSTTIKWSPNGIYDIQTPQGSKAFKLPKYRNVQSEIYKLQEQKRFLILNQIVKTDEKAFDAIKNLEIQIKDLQSQLDSSGDIQKDVPREAVERMQELYRKKSEWNESDVQEVIKLNQQMLDWQTEHEKYIQTNPGFMVEWPNEQEVEVAAAHDEDADTMKTESEAKPDDPKVKDKKIIKKKEKKTKEKDRQVEHSKKIEQVKDKVFKTIIDNSYPLNLFNFRNDGDCGATFNRNKSYTISKDDFIKIVDSNPDLKSRFPKGFKSLNKKELCQLLFKIARGQPS
jgi:hypothetical protein